MDKTYLTITLRKEVETSEEGRIIYDLVKQRLADRPDVKISGSCSTQYDLEIT